MFFDNRIRWTAGLLLSLASLQAAGRQFLHGHVPEALAASTAARPMARLDRVTVAIGLPLRHQDELNTLLNQLVDPHSRNFRRYLTPAQFTERFGPTETDYQALTSFIEANGLSVTGTHPNRMILDVGGTVAAFESAFHVNMMFWRHPTRGEFFAPDRDPSLDTSVAILHISGLDNFALPRPMDLQSRPLSTAAQQTSGSGPGGLFNGADYRNAYAPSVTMTGAGQSVGLLEFDGFYAMDVALNFNWAGVTPVPVTTVLLDGVSGVPGQANVEVTLDIMMASYMAPGLTNVIVYEGGDFNDALNRMATDNLASQLSSSWSFGPIGDTTLQIFTEMAAQGQSFFQASGDQGAYTDGIMPPADVPNLTTVGGTMLTTAGPGGAWQSETTWPGSGGGVSTFFPIPSYQQTVNAAAAGGSSTMRNIPDVALLSVQIFLICDNGYGRELGGTSAAAPLWAGFMALANQQAAINGTPPIGFANPALYAIGAGSSYQSDLNDIGTGNNGGFNALPGYDLATGWGSPAGQPLINSLTMSTGAQSFGLATSASTLVILAGTSANSTITISGQNGFTGSVNLTASGLPAGVTASFSPATVATASILTLTASSSAVTSTSTITITGTSGSLTNTAQLSLTVTGLPAFTMAASPASLSIAQGTGGNRAISVTPQNGFTGAVALTATGLPTGVTASFAPPSTTKKSTLQLTAGASATLGTATVTITGTSGSLSSTASLNLTIAAAPAFTISAPPTSLTILQGATAAGAITVTPLNGFSGAVALAASGLPAGVTASFSRATTTTPGTLTLTAGATATLGTSTVTITGTSGSLASTATLSLTVAAPPSFTLTASPTSLTVVQGATAAGAITVTPLNGFSGAVALAASGLPAGVIASFSAATTLTLTAGASAALGTATVTIAGTSGSLRSTASLNLTIAAAPAFTISASPTSLTILQAATAAATIAIAPLNGFSGSVALAASGLPAGVTASFSKAGTLTLTAGASATLGTATVTITGTSGSLSSTATLSLTVAAPPSFALTASPASLTVPQGATGASTITLFPHNGFNGAVAFTATGLPSGVTATFTSVGALNRTATFTAIANASTAAATVTITGTSGSLTAKVTIALTIVPQPTFTLAVTPTTLSVTPGASGAGSIAITDISGFTGTVALAASGLPKGVTATLGAVKSGSGTLTLTAASTAAAGTSTVTITGTSGALSSKATIALTVNPPPGFTLAATPASFSVTAGASGAGSLAITAISGFTGAVTFSASGLPKGVTATFSAVTSGKSAVTFAAASSAAAGASTVTITGKSGSLTATTSIALTVVSGTR